MTGRYQRFPAWRMVLSWWSLERHTALVRLVNAKASPLRQASQVESLLLGVYQDYGAEDLLECGCVAFGYRSYWDA
jgi:hypothetical protein